jgi:hypothetical protein
LKSSASGTSAQLKAPLGPIGAISAPKEFGKPDIGKYASDEIGGNECFRVALPIRTRGGLKEIANGMIRTRHEFECSACGRHGFTVMAPDRVREGKIGDSIRVVRAKTMSFLEPFGPLLFASKINGDRAQNGLYTKMSPRFPL